MQCKNYVVVKLCLLIIYSLTFLYINAQNVYEYNNRCAFAEQLFSYGDYASAALECKNIIDSYPPDERIIFMYVRSLCAQQNYTKACSFVESQAEYMQHAKLFAMYIQLLLKTNKYSQADSLLKQTHILNSSDHNTLYIYSKLLSNNKDEALQRISICKDKNIRNHPKSAVSRTKNRLEVFYSSSLFCGL